MDIQSAIREYLIQNVLFSDGSFEYSDDASFLGEGILDSVGVMELVLFVEQKFDIKVQDHEITPDNFDSVSRLTQYIQAKQAAQGENV